MMKDEKPFEKSKKAFEDALKELKKEGKGESKSKSEISEAGECCLC